MWHKSWSTEYVDRDGQAWLLVGIRHDITHVHEEWIPVAAPRHAPPRLGAAASTTASVSTQTQDIYGFGPPAGYSSGGSGSHERTYRKHRRRLAPHTSRAMPGGASDYYVLGTTFDGYEQPHRRLASCETRFQLIAATLLWHTRHKCK
jgi:hypothetical protein